jgi:hypothetical protein
MRRRDFISLIGGAAATWPVAARAQQREQMRRIGVLMSAASETDQQAGVMVFLEVLHQLGWIDGHEICELPKWWFDLDGKRASSGSRKPGSGVVLEVARGLFNNLVRAGKQRLRHGEPERLRVFEIDDQLILRRCLNRKLRRLLALEDAINVARCPAVLIINNPPIGD